MENLVDTVKNAGYEIEDLSLTEITLLLKSLTSCMENEMFLAATDGASEEGIRAALVANAYKRVGDTYSNANRHKPGYADCSSLVQWIYEETIPQAKKDGSFSATSAGQGVFCHNAHVTFGDEGSLAPGDLIFWALKGKYFRPSQFSISHVGMVMTTGNGVSVIEATPRTGINAVHIFDRIRNKKDLVFYACPVKLYTGEVIVDVPYNVKAKDSYDVVSTSEYVQGKVLEDGQKYIYYYCGCSMCRENSTCDGGNCSRDEGIMAISPALQIDYVGAKDTVSDVGDETGTIMAISDVLYKCRDYSEGRFALDTDTVGIYTEDHGRYSSKIPWSDRMTCDGIDPDESFNNNHIAAIFQTYEHQITTSLGTYAVRSIEPDNITSEPCEVYRHSGNTFNSYIDAGDGK